MTREGAALAFGTFVVIACGIAIGALIGAGLGVLASWVLSGFGVEVAWYYCWGALVLLGMLLRNARGSKS